MPVMKHSSTTQESRSRVQVQTPWSMDAVMYHYLEHPWYRFQPPPTKTLPPSRTWHRFAIRIASHYTHTHRERSQLLSSTVAIVRSRSSVRPLAILGPTSHVSRVPGSHIPHSTTHFISPHTHRTAQHGEQAEQHSTHTQQHSQTKVRFARFAVGRYMHPVHAHMPTCPPMRPTFQPQIQPSHKSNPATAHPQPKTSFPPT